jgi:CheY-like chemotaxis protein
MLADKAQLDRSYMSQIERGVKNATLTSISRIADGLSVRVEDLIHMTEQIAGPDPELSQVHPEQTLQGAEKSSKEQNSPTVLVADDDQDVCEAVASILLDAGFDARVAHSGLDAMRILSTMKVDALVSDVRMASGNGIELLASVKKHFSAVPVYFITGYEDLSCEEALSRGAKGIFSKPFNITEFVRAIQKAVSVA